MPQPLIYQSKAEKQAAYRARRQRVNVALYRLQKAVFFARANGDPEALGLCLLCQEPIEMLEAWVERFERAAGQTEEQLCGSEADMAELAVDPVELAVDPVELAVDPVELAELLKEAAEPFTDF